MANDTLNVNELENMDPKSAFDIVMKNAPFLRGIVEGKIAAEVADRDAEIQTLKGSLDEMTFILLDTMAMGVMNNE